MNNQELQVFLDIIDKRVKKFVNENKILKQYCGVITNLVKEGNEVLSSKYKVRLLGDETEFTFLNKTGEKLEVRDYVYIQTVGNDLNTGVITYKTGESLNNVDYIIEEGASGIWTYRKWASGKAECWGRKHITTSMSQVTNNTFYYLNTSFLETNYPFEFKEAPNEIVTYHAPSSHMGWVYSQWENTNSHSGQYCAMRWNSVTSEADVYLDYYVVGMWK